MEGLYFEITVIICLASALSILFRFIRQPAILAYILTGVLLNYFHVFEANSHINLESLGELGVTFLLFMLGLELKLRELKTIGLPAVIAGSLQMWFCFVLGFFIAYLLGFNNMAAIYLGIAFSF
jgi:CPA2 family monovalent cation:H+ antiporter-2